MELFIFKLLVTLGFISLLVSGGFFLAALAFSRDATEKEVSVLASIFIISFITSFILGDLAIVLLVIYDLSVLLSLPPKLTLFIYLASSSLIIVYSIYSIYKAIKSDSEGGLTITARYLFISLLILTGLNLFIHHLSLNKYSQLLETKEKEIIEICVPSDSFILNYELHNFPNCYLPTPYENESCFNDIEGYVEVIHTKEKIKRKICFVYTNNTCVTYKC